jgi:hypothetical protein
LVTAPVIELKAGLFYKLPYIKVGKLMRYKAMLEIANALKPYCKTIKWVNNPPNTPCGWDIADSDWTPKQAIKYIRENMVSVPYNKPEKDPLSKPIRFVEW